MNDSNENDVIEETKYQDMLLVESEMYIAKDVNVDGKKIYFNMKCEEVKLQVENNQNLYEILHSNKRMKMYIDYEVFYEDIECHFKDANISKENEESYLVEVITESIEEFLNKFGYEKPICNVMTASNNEKFSFHFCVENIILSNYEDSEAFHNKFLEFIDDDEICSFIDSSVYSNNRLMRLCGQSKFGQNRPLKILCGSEDVSDHFITNTRGDKPSIVVPADWFKPDVVWVKKEYNEDAGSLEVLVSMIIEKIEDGTHSKCDKGNDTIKYEDFMKLATAIIKSTNGDENLYNSVYHLYRNSSSDSTRHSQFGRIMKIINKKKKKSMPGIELIHSWARENERYFDVYPEPELKPLLNLMKDDVEKVKRAKVKIIKIKEENPLYVELFEEIQSTFITTDEDIGKYILKLIVDTKNIYFSSKRNLLFIYNETDCIFEEDFHLEKIMNYISDPIIKILDRLYTKIDDIYETSTKDEKSVLNDFIKKIQQLRVNIKSTARQRAIFKQIINRLPDSDKFIEENFNRIPYLFPIADNKVINFKTLEVIPRTKEHCFTYTTNNVFYPTRPNKDNVNKYIREILKTENQDFVKSFLTWYGYCLTGENCIKVILFNTGDGDNGKSAFHNLQKEVAGKSWVIANDKVFIQSKANSVHFDEIIPLIGKRSTSIQEIDRESSFNERILKTISGNDGLISVRGCGGKTTEQSITCKLNCFCNSDDLPPFKDKQGFANRIKVFSFSNKFKKNPKKVIEINALKNDYFTELCYYVKHYFYDNEMNIDFSYEVELASNEYKDEVNTVKQFFNECIIITGDKKDKIPKMVLYGRYRYFCKENELTNFVKRTKFYEDVQNDYMLEIYRKVDYKGIKEIIIDITEEKEDKDEDE